MTTVATSIAADVDRLIEERSPPEHPFHQARQSLDARTARTRSAVCRTVVTTRPPARR